MKKEIPFLIEKALDHAAEKYAESPHTTNAGAFLRFFARFVTVGTVVKLFAHKLKKPS